NLPDISTDRRFGISNLPQQQTRRVVEIQLNGKSPGLGTLDALDVAVADRGRDGAAPIREGLLDLAGKRQQPVQLGAVLFCSSQRAHREGTERLRRCDPTSATVVGGRAVAAQRMDNLGALSRCLRED